MRFFTTVIRLLSPSEPPPVPWRREDGKDVKKAHNAVHRRVEFYPHVGALGTTRVTEGWERTIAEGARARLGEPVFVGPPVDGARSIGKLGLVQPNPHSRTPVIAEAAQEIVFLLILHAGQRVPAVEICARTLALGQRHTARKGREIEHQQRSCSGRGVTGKQVLVSVC